MQQQMQDLRHHTHAPPLGLPSVNTCNFYFCQELMSAHCINVLPRSIRIHPQRSPRSPPIPTHPHPSLAIPSHPQPSPYGLVQKSGGGGGRGGGAGGGRARRASSSSSSSPKSGAGARAAWTTASRRRRPARSLRARSAACASTCVRQRLRRASACSADNLLLAAN